MQALTPIDYLDSLHVDYSVVHHATSFTAQETAQSAHIKGKDFAKVIVVGSKQSMSMVVVQANCKLMKSDLARMLNEPDLTIVAEKMFAERFPLCEVGAMPPFGKLYGMNVFIARDLALNNWITFNGGTHNLLIKMHTEDFVEISNARIIAFGFKDANLMRNSEMYSGQNWHSV